MEWILIYLAIKYLGDFHQVYDALKRREFVPLSELEHIRMALAQKKLQALTIVDDDYPSSLKSINNPPLVIFYQGNRHLFQTPGLMFTGEFTNPMITQFVDQAIQEMSQKYTLISNNFKALDERIIQGFLQAGKNVIVVLANSLDDVTFNFDPQCYPNQLLIVSEFPAGTHPTRQRIAQRNRLAIGLAEALVIASSYKKSGIMNLVSHALDQGKDVYCYPGLQTEEDGNNLLIQEGAHLITSVKAVGAHAKKPSGISGIM